MKVTALCLAAASLLVFGTGGAGAQMVVGANVSGRVDHPFHRDDGPYRSYSSGRIHRRGGAYRSNPRFVIVRSSFPMSQPFGWFNCCQ